MDGWEQTNVKSRTRRRRAPRHIGSVLLAAVAAWALVGAASAQAAIVTVGSPLTGAFSSVGFIGSDATLANFALPEPGANVTSPVTGTIIRWRITQASGGPFRLRVLTPGGGTTYTGAGTSPPGTPTSTATQTFTANLPISAGQVIGLDQTWPAQIGVQSISGSGAVWGNWVPPLADGATVAGSTGSSDTEIAFNADVQFADPAPPVAPSNAFTIGKVKGKTVELTTPGPGKFVITDRSMKDSVCACFSAATAAPTGSGAGAAAAKALLKLSTATVSNAGTVTAPLLLTGPAKKKLRQKGKLRVNAAIAFTPTGGTARGQTATLKLKKK
jgi:hypothetical protein